MPRTICVILGVIAAPFAWFGCSGKNERFDLPGLASSIRIEPLEVDLGPGESQQFAAFPARGDAPRKVIWSVVEPHGGAISSDGRYVAPGTPGTYTVAATDPADSALRGTARVVVHEAGTGGTGGGGAGGGGGTGAGGAGGTGGSLLRVEPANVDLATGDQQQFVAVFDAGVDGGVVWSVEPERDAGTIDSAGVYTAPMTPGTYQVVAASVRDPSARGTAVVRVRAISIEVRPEFVEVITGGRQQFTATVTGGANLRIAWTVEEADGGAIDDHGMYVAPGSTGVFHVVATSVADTSKRARAEVSVVRPSSTDATGLLPPERQTRWLPGLNAVGGIPTDTDPDRPAIVYLPAGNPYGGYSVDPALGTQTGNARSAIQAALDAAGAQASERSRRVVLVKAGEYVIRGEGLNVPSFVTLRGEGPRGPAATRLVKPSGTQMSVINMGHLWLKHTTPIDVVSDVAHGATQVTVARNPGYQVGELVFIDQLVDSARVGSWWNPVNQGDPGGGPRGWFSRQNRPTGQVLEIVKVEGSTLTFGSPIRLPYFTSNQAQVVRFAGSQGGGSMVPTKRWSGVEDLYVAGGEGGDGGGNIHLFGTSYSWVKNVESERSEGTSIAFESTYRCTLRDSFVHSTVSPNPGGGGYGIGLLTYASDNLIENNISWNFNKVVIMRATGGGNVIGYNYFEDGWGAGYPTIPEVGLNASHYATPHHELFEGNQSFNISGDAIWGNSIFNTFFRNHVTGVRRSIAPLQLKDEVMRRFVEVPEWHLNFSYIGNVIGFSGMNRRPQSGFEYEATPPWDWNPVPMWAIGVEHSAGKKGQDAEVVATTIRHGNFDYVTNGIVWDSEIDRKDLPPSLYLESKPAFFGVRPWPWVDPENEAQTTTHVLPARERFDQLMGL